MDDTTVETVQNDIVESAPVETRSARLQNLSTQPDYSIPELYTTDMAFKESTMQLTAPEIENLVRSSGLKGSRWEQTGVAVENALTGMNNLRDEMRITVGNLANAISGGSVGQELQDLGYRNIDNTMASMQLNEDSVGGVTDLVAKLVGGATSFTQLAAESIISAGVLPLAHIGIQTYGEGAYNDMKKYEEEHGSLEGYKPESVDVAINLLNSAFQVGSEAWLGVGSPRFLRGWSRGAWKEGLSGFVQESIQGAVNDFAEIAKGNKEFSDMLDSADDYLVDGVIGAVLQGGLGAATYSTARRKSDNIIARAHAIAKGRKTPNREDFDIAKKLNDAKEREYASVLTTEFKAQFDASTGEGKLQQNIANALNKAVQAKELDLGTDSETDLAQKLEAIATQETMNAMEMAAEQGKSVSEMELNNIVYKDGAIYLEGETPELGERAVDRARVIAERQSGLAEAKTKLDALNQEIKETQKALDEAKAAAKEAQVKRLQARLEKQQALEAKRTQEAERLQAQTEKLQKRIESRLAEQEQAQVQETPTQEVAPTTEMPAVETATETQATVADTQALEELTRAVRDNEIALTKLERAQWEKMNEPQTAQQTPQAQQVAQAERVQFAKQMLDKYKPDWQKSIKPMAQVAQKAQPKPMAKVLEKAAKYKGEKKSLKVEREAQKKAKAKKTTAPTVEDAESQNILKQSKVEGTGSDKYRGGYDEKLKRIILGEKSDLTTIQHEFAHYWIQNNFKWARSGWASQDWLRRWRDVEEALGIEPQDRYLSRQASEKFARAYERYIMEGKVADDLKWAFDGFQKFYKDTYEDLENEYFDLSEELDPKIVDWFNRQRPVTEEQLKQDTYKRVAEVAMSQGAEIITETGDGNYVVSSMNKDGEVVSDVVVDNQQAQQSKLAKFRDTQKNRSVVEGLRESNPNIKSDQYNVLNRAETVDQARQWISNDRAGAWQALNSDSTNIIDRTALFQAFKELAENGDYALGAELASIKFPKQMTEIGQALSVLGERAEFDPLTILETKQKSLGVPTAEDVATQINEMGLDTELTAEQVQELENTTECAL